MRSGEEKFLSLEVCTHDADGDDMTHKYIVEEFSMANGDRFQGECTMCILK